jgi:hypothetical protein
VVTTRRSPASQRNLAHYLLRLGSAQAGLRRFEQAHGTLTESCAIFESLPVDVFASEKVDSLRAGVGLLEQCQQAESEPARASTLEGWKQRLASAQAAPGA